MKRTERFSTCCNPVDASKKEANALTTRRRTQIRRESPNFASSPPQLSLYDLQERWNTNKEGVISDKLEIRRFFACFRTDSSHLLHSRALDSPSSPRTSSGIPIHYQLFDGDRRSGVIVAIRLFRRPPWPRIDQKS